MRVISQFLCLISCVALLSACASSDNLEKPSPLVEFTPKIQLTKLWSSSVGGTDKHYLNLTLGQQAKVIYTASYNGELTATDAQTGKQLWQKDLNQSLISGVSVAHQMAIVATEDGSLVAVNANNGTVLWQQNVGNQVIGLVAIGRRTVVAKTVNDTVIALRTNNGKQLWRYNAEQAPQIILRGGSQPVIEGDKVIIGFADGKISALSLRSGTLLWQQAIATPEGSFAVQRMVDITASPKVSNGVIYAASYQGNIAALEVDSGQIIWNHKLSAYTGIALSNNAVYATDAKSNVWKFQQDTGEVAWRQKRMQARTLTAPALVGQNVVMGDSEGYVHWLSTADGSFVAREHLSSKAIQAAPIVAGHTIYVLDVSGDLAAYSY
jgi:outer membrane protein assembly factor BamB